MRVLCCLDGFNIDQMSRAVSSMLRTDTLSLGIIYVIDAGPQGEMERQRERRFRTAPLSPMRKDQMQQAEQLAAQEILDEGIRYLPGAEQLLKAGRPEREIVANAATWRAELIVICPRSPNPNKPSAPTGPRSVGHVARFVLDHAPCPVLLIREQGGNP
jgi:nucleotide-binding universal stress UspA family protein